MGLQIESKERTVKSLLFRGASLPLVIVFASGLLIGFGQIVKAKLTKIELPRSLETSEKASDKKYKITTRRRALLNTIRFAEGTWKGGDPVGYKTLYGGQIFKDLSRHPNRTIIKTYTSAAAGAYQFIPSTWIAIADELKLPNFEPEHQDQAAIHLVNKRGVLNEIDRKGLTKFAISELSNDWASFPNPYGKSNYGQPTKKVADLTNFYKVNLKILGQIK